MWRNSLKQALKKFQLFLWRVVIISTKIDLEINRETRDMELEKKISDLLPLIRIFSKIKFPELEIPEDAFKKERRGKKKAKFFG